MMPTGLPQGRYFSCALTLLPEGGGQTRALLMRNRILMREGGVRPELLTLGSAADNPERCQALREQGLLEDMSVRNIYAHYRERGWGDSAPTGELDDLSGLPMRDDTTPSGEPWRRVYRPGQGKRRIVDYLRADGSPYLRERDFGGTGPRRIQRIAADGSVVGELGSLGQWFRGWIRGLLGDDTRAFVFVDSRFVVPHLVPMRDHRIHLIYTMHNLHVGPPRRWDSEMNAAYRRVLRRIGGMDAMVTLTERQRDDIAARRGRTTNMFVVPNPVVMPEPPAPRPQRDPNRAAIVARLEPQKGLADAIAAFQEVVRAVPTARLDIYGQGSERDRLAAEIETRGLSESVVLRGFDPRASESLWESSAFLMTSVYEGYPLSPLESMSRGCPVVSYDIKYGPREQITDGVEGFLVPAGDTSLLARRVIELLRSPELVARMSAAALARAESFGPREFLASWARVLDATLEHKPLRTRIEHVRLELRALRRAGLVERALAGRPRRALRLDGVLEVDGHGGAGWDAVELELAWIDTRTGEVSVQPLRVRRDGRTFRIRSTFGLPAHAARLRLRLTWRNSAWEDELGRCERGRLRRRR